APPDPRGGRRRGAGLELLRDPGPRPRPHPLGVRQAPRDARRGRSPPARAPAARVGRAPTREPSPPRRAANAASPTPRRRDALTRRTGKRALGPRIDERPRGPRADLVRPRRNRPFGAALRPLDGCARCPPWRVLT